MADIWKNILKDLETGELEFPLVEDFLAELIKEFSKGNNKLAEVELKKIKQESKMMKEFVQEFRRAVRESGYEERLLIEEFKRNMSDTII